MTKSSSHGISVVVHDIPDPLGQHVIESMSMCWGNVGPVAEYSQEIHETY